MYQPLRLGFGSKTREFTIRIATAVQYILEMKKPKRIDYTQRPESYWDDKKVLAQLLHGISDSDQKSRITKHWKNGAIGKLVAELQGRETEEEGGFLPACRPWEVEIALIELDSVHGDIISVRAAKSERDIRYSVVDEYEGTFTVQRETSDQPLTLQEMIQFLDGTTLPGVPGGIALGYNRMNAQEGDTNRAELRHFTTIKSRFYPALSRHYEQVFEEWVISGGE